VLSVESVETIPTVRASNEGFFHDPKGPCREMSKTVETTPTIDNPGDHPTACGDFGLRAWEYGNKRNNSAAPGLAMGVLKFDGRRTTSAKPAARAG
jgi:hypothetical protein